MKIAYNIKDYSIYDIDETVQVTVSLHRTDKQSMHSVQLANEASTVLQARLQEHIFQWKQQQGTNGQQEPLLSKRLQLCVTITRCTEGSRCGRICCGELGMGWALFFFDWSLQDMKTQAKIIGVEKESFRDAGMIGFADLCDSDVGDKAVKDAASFTGPQTIRTKIQNAFSN